MGGQGSGRQYYFGAKDTTEAYRHLDIRRLQREGLLTPGQTYGWHWSHYGERIAAIGLRVASDRIILTYRQRSGEGEWQDREYPVRLDWSGCHYGGRRAWFRCPARGCGRRVAILYSGSIFACRHCHRLVYQSQRDRPADRIAGKAEKIRRRLGWQAGILNGPGTEKPKGMRWETYWRLHSEHHQMCQEAFALMLQSLGLGRKR
jgi:hypothetical protein